MLVIGIAGGTGSGKTTVVNQIINELPEDEVCAISQDSYYKATDNLSYEERIKINFDHPRAIDFDLLETHISDLKSGKIIQQPIYSFKTHNRTKDSIKTHPRKVVIIEGILIFNSKKLLDLFSKGKLNGTVHTCIGQEFSAISFLNNFMKGDWAISNHRGHGHFLSITKDFDG